MIGTKLFLPSLIWLNLLLGGFFLITDHDVNISENQTIIANISPSELDQESDFNQFLDILKTKGMSFLTLLEAGALYFLWTVIKDTKSREEILEKVFDRWENAESQTRVLGRLFRTLGISCLAIHEMGISEILIHLKQGHVVILLEDINKESYFFFVKSIENKKFILTHEFIYESKMITEFDIKKDKYNVLIFLNPEINSFLIKSNLNLNSFLKDNQDTLY